MCCILYILCLYFFTPQQVFSTRVNSAVSDQPRLMRCVLNLFFSFFPSAVHLEYYGTFIILSYFTNFPLGQVFPSVCLFFFFFLYPIKHTAEILATSCATEQHFYKWARLDDLDVCLLLPTVTGIFFLNFDVYIYIYSMYVFIY